MENTRDQDTFTMNNTREEELGQTHGIDSVEAELKGARVTLLAELLPDGDAPESQPSESQPCPLQPLHTQEEEDAVLKSTAVDTRSHQLVTRIEYDRSSDETLKQRRLRVLNEVLPDEKTPTPESTSGSSADFAQSFVRTMQVAPTMPLSRLQSDVPLPRIQEPVRENGVPPPPFLGVSTPSSFSSEVIPPPLPLLAYSTTVASLPAVAVHQFPRVDAVALEMEQPTSPSSTEKRPSKSFRRRLWTIGFIVGSICLCGLILFGTLRLRDNDGSSGLSGLKPGITETQGRGSPKAFQDLDELREAVKAYLYDNSEESEVAATYGWPIGTWNVSQVTSFYKLFSTHTNPEAIKSFDEDIGDWDTSSVITMEDCFLGAESFNQDLSRWDVSRVDWMVGVFHDARSFNGNISNWDVSNVYTMSRMFTGATSFNQDLSRWDVSRVTFMLRTFEGAIFFNQNLSTWDVGRVRRMEGTFRGATSFNGDISTWDTSQVEDISDLFHDAVSFKGDISGFDVSSVVWMSRAFRGASSFSSDVSSWQTSKVSFFDETFAHAAAFRGDISGWDVSSAIDMTDMLLGATSFSQNLCSWGATIGVNVLVHRLFEGSNCDETSMPLLGALQPGPFCSRCDDPSANTSPSFPASFPTEELSPSENACFESLEELQTAVDAYLEDSAEDTPVAMRYGYPIGSWCVSRVTSFYKLFDGDRNRAARTFNEDISDWDTSSAISMEGMFRRAFFFDKDVSRWNVSKVESMKEMFSDAREFDKDLSTWDTSNVLSMQSMFERALVFNGNVVNWDMSRVRSTKRMFWNAEKFNRDVSSWDVSSAFDMGHTFFGCTVFDQNLSRWNVSSMVIATGMFNFATAFNGDVSTWDVSRTVEFGRMFEEASAFNQDLSGWDMSSARTIERMFHGASSFNGDISNWDVSRVIAFRQTFDSASAFNRDVSSWDVSSGEFFSGMFASAPLYSHSLCEWGSRLQDGFIVDPDLPMFSNTNCASTDNPDQAEESIGPLCGICDTRHTGAA